MLAQALVVVTLAASGGALVEARRLADDQRYEEAVVEYQRVLGSGAVAGRERAQALFEQGYIHLVLGDQANADARGLEALEVDEALTLPATAPPKQLELLKRLKAQFAARPRLALVERLASDAPNVVRLEVTDAARAVRRVVLRHSLAQGGPYAAVDFTCDDAGHCSAPIPPPSDGASFTSFYFVEALDEAKATVARAGAESAPRQLSVVSQRLWYRSPWVWGISGAAVVGIAAVLYLLTPPPP